MENQSKNHGTTTKALDVTRDGCPARLTELVDYREYDNGYGISFAIIFVSYQESKMANQTKKSHENK